MQQPQQLLTPGGDNSFFIQASQQQQQQQQPMQYAQLPAEVQLLLQQQQQFQQPPQQQYQHSPQQQYQVPPQQQQFQAPQPQIIYVVQPAPTNNQITFQLPQPVNDFLHNTRSYDWVDFLFTAFLGFETGVALVLFLLFVYPYFFAIPCGLAILIFGILNDKVGWLWFGVVAHFGWWFFSLALITIFRLWWAPNIIATMTIVFLMGCFNLVMALKRKRQQAAYSAILPQSQTPTWPGQQPQFQQPQQPQQSFFNRQVTNSAIFLVFFGCAQLAFPMTFLLNNLAFILFFGVAALALPGIYFGSLFCMVMTILFEGFLIVPTLIATANPYGYGFMLLFGALSLETLTILACMWNAWRLYKTHRSTSIPNPQ